MRGFMVLFLCLHAASAVTHSLQYFFTASSPEEPLFTASIPNFPEFVVVSMVDHIQIIYYDSNNPTAVPKQDWMNNVTDGDPQYWKRNTGYFVGAQQVFKNNIEVVKQRFNQSGGVHTFQMMYGCEWDEETGLTEGYEQYGYDGEDFIVFDLKNMRWIAAAQQAFITKNKYDNNRAKLEYDKHYYTQTCIEWLKKYLDYGKNTLKRTVPPSVSLLQKSPSSPVTCHATGFYPRGVMVFWRRDGEEVFEDVDLGETLPNQDGTFQARSTLSVSAEELETHNYTCVVQHSGDKHHDIILNVADLKNEGKGLSDGAIAAIIIISVLPLAIIVGVVFYMKLVPWPI